MKICKRFCIKNKVELGDSIEVEVLNKNLIIEQPQMRPEGLHNLIRQTKIRFKNIHNPPLVQKPKIDLGKISSENPLDRLVKPTQKLVKSVIRTSSKVHKLKTYNKAVNNLINRNK